MCPCVPVDKEYAAHPESVYSLGKHLKETMAIEFALARTGPGLDLRGQIGDRTTLLSIAKARRMLGYDPQHTQRDHVHWGRVESWAARHTCASCRPRASLRSALTCS